MSERRRGRTHFASRRLFAVGKSESFFKDAGFRAALGRLGIWLRYVNRFSRQMQNAKTAALS